MMKGYEKSSENGAIYDLSALTILRHLKDSVELEFCSHKLVSQLMKLAESLILEQYELLYERLRIKECFLIQTYSQNGKSATIEETEVLVDTITHYREGL